MKGKTFSGIQLSLVISLLAMMGVACGNAFSAQFGKDVLSYIQELYGIDEDQALDRLAREGEAAELYVRIRESGLDSYAGSWFDHESLGLHVAVTDPSDVALVEFVGGIPIVVSHSLERLENLRVAAYSAIQSEAENSIAVRWSYIDFERNRVVIGIAPGENLHAKTLMSSHGLKSADVELIEVPHEIEFSSGTVTGAMGTRNHTWAQQSPGPWLCSSGAAVHGGYVTAGHCGWQDNEMRTSDGEPLGIVAGSNLLSSTFYTHNEDGAWVQTLPSWSPQPQIDGYSDGVISVPAVWAGVLEVPVGATVCRYGQTSGGPHCGPVLQKNFNFWMTGHYFEGFVRAGVCTDDGDSGGPYLSAAGNQVQGTNTGGSPTNNCPNPGPSDFAVYQPITTTLSRFGPDSEWLQLLTLHGAVRPIISGVKCPDSGSSGQGMYICSFESYDSQGKTTINWTSNTGNASNSTILVGSCSSGQTVNVELEVSNPYGQRNQMASFACPTGPIN